MKTAAAVLAALTLLGCAGSMPAQPGSGRDKKASHVFSVRPFFLTTIQRFAADQTFTAVFGGATQPFFGGGVDITFRRHIFVDLAVSRFSKQGQRVFVFGNQTYPLGIPLRATKIPLEASIGYRFSGWHRIRPYAGSGLGSYGYKETSDFSTSVENVDARHIGYLAVGGGEVRINSWVAVAVDVQWTHVPGILGTAGVSQGSGFGGAENDLGGIAPRIRVILGH